MVVIAITVVVIDKNLDGSVRDVRESDEQHVHTQLRHRRRNCRTILVWW